MTGARRGRLYTGGRRLASVLPRLAVLPNNIGPDETVLSNPLEPSDVLLAEGDPEGDAGDSVMSGRRLPAGSEGAAGDSQKNEPRPGEPLKELAPENDGDAPFRGKGESISMLLPCEELDLGDIWFGSV